MLDLRISANAVAKASRGHVDTVVVAHAGGCGFGRRRGRGRRRGFGRRHGFGRRRGRRRWCRCRRRGGRRGRRGRRFRRHPFDCCRRCRWRRHGFGGGLPCCLRWVGEGCCPGWAARECRVLDLGVATRAVAKASRRHVDTVVVTSTRWLGSHSHIGSHGSHRLWRCSGFWWLSGNGLGRCCSNGLWRRCSDGLWRWCNRRWSGCRFADHRACGNATSIVVRFGVAIIAALLEDVRLFAACKHRSSAPSGGVRVRWE